MIFRFKSFTIRHQKSAMKVGTDGVLLGAWLMPSNQPKKVLDIGSGCGLIAIMMAQRFSNATIEAIEIEKEAALEAQHNMQASKWSSRLKCYHCSLQNFKSTYLFDFIVCNPPFFSDTTLSHNDARQMARHNHSLNLEELLMYSKNLLSASGEMAMILPSSDFEFLTIEAKKQGMFIVHLCWVRGNEKSAYKRILVKLSKVKQPLKQQYLTIEKNRHEYSQDYINLCQDFYLNF